MKDSGKTSFLEMREVLNKKEISNYPELNVTILRNIIIEPIEIYLKFFALQYGYKACVSFGSYDNIFQEALSPSPKLLNSNTDCVLIFCYLDIVLPNISNSFVTLTLEQIEEEKLYFSNYVDNVIIGVRKQTTAMILWYNFELPMYSTMGILDYQNEKGQSKVIHELNNILREKLQKQRNAFVVDMNMCLARVGVDSYYDRRYWHLSRAPYSKEAYYQIATESSKFIRALKGKNKKCLVLDCDNTLWGGIIGEDGLAGIQLATTYPGSLYFEFQQLIVDIHYKGIIIALCSKNNEQDVWNVFRNHPNMLLTETQISTYQINWEDKVANIIRISEELNIGLDSIVFIDDNEYEINYVKQYLPEVEAILLSKNKILDSKAILLSQGLFDTLTVSNEDRKRGDMYKSENQRKKFLAKTECLDEYLASLKLRARICLLDDYSLPRIAQLTQKTNQFNLTTKRYSEEVIMNIIANGGDVFSLQLQDKFGDYGIVGACIVIYEQGKAIIDTFLLSCRVLGRGAEDVFLADILHFIKKTNTNINFVQGLYIATEKNVQVQGFYVNRKFIPIGITGGCTISEFNLDNDIFTGPCYYNDIISCIQ